jgi:hypothetical protein
MEVRPSKATVPKTTGDYSSLGAPIASLGFIRNKERYQLRFIMSYLLVIFNISIRILLEFYQLGAALTVATSLLLSGFFHGDFCLFFFIFDLPLLFKG